MFQVSRDSYEFEEHFLVIEIIWKSPNLMRMSFPWSRGCNKYLQDNFSAIHEQISLVLVSRDNKRLGYHFLVLSIGLRRQFIEIPELDWI